jgi:hypothetical protein
MSLYSDLKMFSRFARGLKSYLSHHITMEEAEAIVRERIGRREENFLRLVEKGIYGYRKSPYLPLLRMARVEIEDIRDMVQKQGLEKTLGALREAGVYVTFEEFKGRTPIIRNGLNIPVEARDFDNPYLSRYYQATSGGSTGAGTRVNIDLEHLLDEAPHIMLAWHAHGFLDAPMAPWLGALPDGSGLKNVLRATLWGNVPRRWFSSVAGGGYRVSLKNRLANRSIISMGRFYGVPLPRPEPTPLDRVAEVAGWIFETMQDEGACLVVTHVSKALRVSLAALENGLDLTGAVFLVGGEPPTPAKVSEIRRSGARCVSFFPFTEAGAVGYGCARPADESDIHFFRDSLALIQYPREVPGSAAAVDAFHFTTLLPTVPKLMLNVESDDYGVLESRSCGCPLEGYGFREHLRQVRSFKKLTGEGVTLVGSDMERILDEVLPARFGGNPLDYQLLEEEDEEGFTRLCLLVSPSIEISDEEAVINTVLDTLGKSNTAADLARSIWSQAGSLRIRRMDPVLTGRGKMMPLQTSGRLESTRPSGSNQKGKNDQDSTPG